MHADDVCRAGTIAEVAIAGTAWSRLLHDRDRLRGIGV
jgi:hypothetical protein